MCNEIVFVAEIFVAFTAVVLCGKLFGSKGLIAWAAVAPVVANIVSLRITTVFGLQTDPATMFASVFLATDILTELYGKKDAVNAVRIGVFVNIVCAVYYGIILLYAPSKVDFIGDALQTVIGSSARLLISSMVALYIGGYLDVIIYSLLKEKTGGKYMWLRNNVATILCNGGDNFIFIFAAFYGVMSFTDCVTVALSATVVESIIAICDTPFLYFAKWWISRRKDCCVE